MKFKRHQNFNDYRFNSEIYLNIILYIADGGINLYNICKCVYFANTTRFYSKIYIII